MSFKLRRLDRDSDSEMNFVRRAWLRCSYNGWLENTPADMHYAVHKPIVEALIHRSVVIVAETDVPGELAGWICFSVGVLHFVYTKATYRRMGAAKMLVSAANPTFASYSTFSSRDVDMLKSLTFNPYLAR